MGSLTVPSSIFITVPDGMTIPAMRVKLRQRLGPTRFWYDIELEDALLEAVRVWQCITGTITINFKTAPTGVQYEPVPGQVARPIRITFGGAGGELDKVSMWELDEGFVGWEGAATASPQLWSHNGFNQIVFYPKPTAALGEVAIDGIADIDWGWRNGVELSEFSPGDEEVIIGYAQHYLSFKEGAGELDNSQELLKKFFARAAAQNARLRRTNFYRAAMGVDMGEQEGSRSVDLPEGGMR